ncbi:PREDICTED: bidirectional sugar transporter SWEET1-like [Prunus mume]|uniref:Bidirectional sugar transporter SWEET1-like n=1 Tax=Prunus mume TaxID=102107 RepID=A0ABM0PTZ9_PRUMU|nr:PREDICTED: bidirectional sugar transporter SWEET1-like [Prunus mume]
MPLYFDAGNGIAFFLFLVPMTTLKSIMKKNEFTEQYLSGIPYLMTLLLSAAWYGLPLVSPKNILVSTINTIGAAIEAIYLLIVFLLAPKMEKDKILELLTYTLSFKQSENPKKIKETLST